MEFVDKRCPCTARVVLRTKNLVDHGKSKVPRLRLYIRLQDLSSRAFRSPLSPKRTSGRDTYTFTPTSLTMKPSILPLLFPALASAYIGGPCANTWQRNHDCICLKTSECKKWDGTIIQGDPGAWACPDDPKDVKGCIPQGHCGLNAACKWTSHCKSLGPSMSAHPRASPDQSGES
jgi:hypothetical protein